MEIISSQNGFRDYSAVFAPSHRLVKNPPRELLTHCKHIIDEDIFTALTSINAYTDKYQDICSLYAAIAYISRFNCLESTRLAYVSENTPKQKDIFSKKFVLAFGACTNSANTAIFDVTEFVTQYHWEDFEKICKDCTSRTALQYVKKHMPKGESLVILPSFSEVDCDTKFKDFLLSNPETMYSS